MRAKPRAMLVVYIWARWRLAAGWTARVRSRVSERWRFFFTPSCPDWSTQPPIKSGYRGISSGVKAAERRTSHPTSPQCHGCEYVDPCIRIPHGPSLLLLGYLYLRPIYSMVQSEHFLGAHHPNHDKKNTIMYKNNQYTWSNFTEI